MMMYGHENSNNCYDLVFRCPPDENADRITIQDRILHVEENYIPKLKKELELRNAHKKSNDYKVGDVVWKQNMQTAGDGSRHALDNRYRGPYVIKELTASSAVIEGLTRKFPERVRVHVDQLKPAHAQVDMLGPQWEPLWLVDPDGGRGRETRARNEFSSGEQGPEDQERTDETGGDPSVPRAEDTLQAPPEASNVDEDEGLISDDDRSTGERRKIALSAEFEEEHQKLSMEMEMLDRLSKGKKVLESSQVLDSGTLCPEATTEDEKQREDRGLAELGEVEVIEETDVDQCVNQRPSINHESQEYEQDKEGAHKIVSLDDVENKKDCPAEIDARVLDETTNDQPTSDPDKSLEKGDSKARTGKDDDRLLKVKVPDKVPRMIEMKRSKRRRSIEEHDVDSMNVKKKVKSNEEYESVNENHKDKTMNAEPGRQDVRDMDERASRARQKATSCDTATETKDARMKHDRSPLVCKRKKDDTYPGMNEVDSDGDEAMGYAQPRAKNLDDMAKSPLPPKIKRDQIQEENSDSVEVDSLNKKVVYRKDPRSKN